MLIERLIIRITNPTIEVIRDISFNLQGLNLIVDKTSEKAEESGNNIGKTTVLNIIDLCLGASTVKKLYFDEDTRTENRNVKSFLEDNKVEAELILIKQENNNVKERVKIVRQLFNRGKRKINDEVITKEDFDSELKNIIFNCNDQYPTFRQLLPKFVRLNDMKADNMIKYLMNMTTNETYDTIYLFLLNREYKDLLNKKNKLCNDLKECENKIRIYSKDNNISSLDFLKQREKLIDDDISELNDKRKNLDYMEEYKEELAQKRKLSRNIDELEKQVEMIEFEINIINKNINKLKEEKNDIKVSKIKTIYEEAKIYLEELEKTFDDVLHFHNNMIENRIDFISKQLKDKNENLDSIIIERDLLLDKKKSITIDVLDEGLLDELNSLNKKIEELNVEKGEIKQSIKLLEDSQKEKRELDKDVEKINSKINSGTIIEKNNIFNKFFASYCEKLYGEKYLFAYDSSWREKKGGFPVYLDAAYKGKMGTGMKKSLTVAFDLAYIMFTDETNIEGPKFVIHDKMENTHINQIKTIFEICKDIKGQYIIPILRERINEISEDEIEKVTILELSENDKLFRL